MLPSRRRLRLDPAVYAEPGRSFSVTIGTSPRQDVFSDVAFGRACVDRLATEAARCAMDILAYCLMPDHAHLLARVRGPTPLPAFIQAWKSLCYAERRGRTQPEPFWQRSFFDHAVRQEEDLRQIALYILANPVRKRLVPDWRRYPLSGSFVFDLSGDPV
jgi:REP element-mobilizing transposase RayT